MILEAVLSNADHPEYGVATIPFPIPKEQYDQCIELVKALEIGDPKKQDCKVMAIDSFYSVLKITENLRINLDELDYLAKRLERFDDGEHFPAYLYERGTAYLQPSAGQRPRMGR